MFLPHPSPRSTSANPLSQFRLHVPPLQPLHHRRHSPSFLWLTLVVTDVFLLLHPLCAENTNILLQLNACKDSTDYIENHIMSLKRFRILCSRSTHHALRLLSSNFIYGSRNAYGATNSGSNDCALITNLYACTFHNTNWFCTTALTRDDDVVNELQGLSGNSSDNISINEAKKVEKVKDSSVKEVDFSKIDVNLLPTVLLIGRPNVGKSALFNRLIRRREALVYNTPNDHVTRDIRDGIAKLGDLRFKVLDSAGLEAEASSGSILSRTADMTGNVLRRSKVALFLTDARDGLQPMDLDVGKWLRRHASGIKIIVVMNKAESLLDSVGSLDKASGEAHKLGFGDAIALSAETGLGMTELYATLRPLLEDFMRETSNDEVNQDNQIGEDDESKLPLQLAIVGRPNVGKSTLLNVILQEDRVLVGPEAGLTRDSVRAQFQYQGRTIFMVDTAGWLGRTKQEKGPASLSIMQSRKNLMRAHVVALVLDGKEVARARRSMTHDEVVIARRAVEEGRGLVVIVNKMDLLNGEQQKSVMSAVPEEVQTVIPQVTGIPVVFISALTGRGRVAVMHQVIDTYEKWCLRLSTARLNRWLRKVMSRHSWKDQAAQPKVKYFTQVKARPPTFVAFLSGKTRLSDTDLRFLTRSLKEDFDIGGIPVRILQRSVTKSGESNDSNSKSSKSSGKFVERTVSDKRSLLAESTP